MAAQAKTDASSPFESLRDIIKRLEEKPTPADEQELAALRVELVAQGPSWEHYGRSYENLDDFERLGKQFNRFDDDQQREIIDAFAPLRETVRRRMEEVASGVNSWLAEAPNVKTAPLIDLKRFLRLPVTIVTMRWYKNCGGLAAKTRFLMAIAAVLRAMAEEPLRQYVASDEEIPQLSQQLVGVFFTLQRYGVVIQAWLDARLRRYNEVWRRGAELAVESPARRQELLQRLCAAVRGSDVSGSHGRLKLQRWPMSQCPLARAFCAFMAAHSGNIVIPPKEGLPPLLESPPHSLQPETLLACIRLLGGALSATDPSEDAPAGLVEVVGSPLPSEGTEAPVVKTAEAEVKAPTAEKSEAAAPAAAARPSPTKDSAATAEQGLAKGSSTPAAVGIGGSMFKRPTSGAAQSLGFDAPALKGQAAKPKPGIRPPLSMLDGPDDGSTRLVRRKIDWKNDVFLNAVVLRGVDVDDEWKQTWYQHCMKNKVLPDGVPTRDALAEFVEQNLLILSQKEWAKDFMWGTDDSPWKAPEDPPPPQRTPVVADEEEEPLMAAAAAAGAMKTEAESALEMAAGSAAARAASKSRSSSSGDSKADGKAQAQKKEESDDSSSSDSEAPQGQADKGTDVQAEQKALAEAKPEAQAKQAKQAKKAVESQPSKPKVPKAAQPVQKQQQPRNQMGQQHFMFEDPYYNHYGNAYHLAHTQAGPPPEMMMGGMGPMGPMMGMGPMVMGGGLGMNPMFGGPALMLPGAAAFGMPPGMVERKSKKDKEAKAKKRKHEENEKDPEPKRKKNMSSPVELVAAKKEKEKDKEKEKEKVKEKRKDKGKEKGKAKDRGREAIREAPAQAKEKLVLKERGEEKEKEKKRKKEKSSKEEEPPPQVAPAKPSKEATIGPRKKGDAKDTKEAGKKNKKDVKIDAVDL